VRLGKILASACDALTEAGETGPRVADGIRALADKASRAQRLQQDIGDLVKVHSQSTEIMRRAHEALDLAGVDRESAFPGGPVARKVYGLAERINMLASKIGDVQAGEGYAREVLEQEAARLRAERDTAERRTEAHRLEIGRLTDTIQRLRAEVAEAKDDARRARDCARAANERETRFHLEAVSWKARADQEISLSAGYQQEIDRLRAERDAAVERLAQAAAFTTTIAGKRFGLVEIPIATREDMDHE
jgi:chromosome segregation ATPase